MPFTSQHEPTPDPNTHLLVDDTIVHVTNVCGDDTATALKAFFTKKRPNPRHNVSQIGFFQLLSLCPYASDTH
ncbi:unnamed protein product [Protopolystoma xenopodis]|uniref:Uncharacterized protein n=1 Tax=Protopolystoma xenopodis TaxID=117903 RepID=A0A3S5A4W9_9PLAT|nr:unnamed protein product [Protopolystoma xenopodis]